MHCIETRGYGAFLVVCLFVVVELGLIDEGLWSRLEGEAAIEGRWCRIETNAGGKRGMGGWCGRRTEEKREIQRYQTSGIFWQSSSVHTRQGPWNLWNLGRVPHKW